MASTIAPPSFASFQRKHERERVGRLLHLIGALANSSTRPSAARALAAHVGAEQLIIFLRDPELEILLPAPGFPQTLPQMPQWQAFLSRCETESCCEGRLPFPGRKTLAKTVGVAGKGGAILVLLGGEPQLDLVVDIAFLLPIIASALCGERIGLVAEAQTTLAKQTATQAKLLATSLNRARDELRHALAEANRANAAKDRFLAVLSHELRTPLNPVLMSASALENDMDLPAEIRNDVAMIRRNIELEANLIDDLLDLTRITNARVILHRRIVDAHELLREAVAMVRADPASICLDVRMNLNASAHFIHADSARIQQIFWNLIRNASKFTRADGHIVVESDNPEPALLRVRIRDNGIGIRSDVLPNIFNAFEQGDPAIVQQFGGLGLGLAISQTLTRLHDGRLCAESAGPGQGAIFTFELGAETDISKQIETSQSPADAARPHRILVVEDHRPTAEVMDRLLRRRGHQIRLAFTQAEALTAIHEQKFDIVISDISLPDGSGYEVMRALRKNSDAVGIAVSGYGMQADVARSASAGFRHHVTKPINAKQLYDLIDRLAADKSSNQF